MKKLINYTSRATLRQKNSFVADINFKIPISQNGQTSQIMCWLLPMNCLSVFAQFVGLGFNDLSYFSAGNQFLALLS